MKDHLFNFSWKGIQGLPKGKSIAHYAAQFRKTAEDPKYPHYLEKATGVEKLADVDPEFPHFVVFEDDYYELDKYEDILWKTLGPKDGECGKDTHTVSRSGHTSHWVCPGIPVDPDYYLKWWERSDYWKKEYLTYEAFFEHINEGPQTVDHSHVGDWTTRWGAKTGYDHGIQVFYFRREQDLKDFLIKASLGPQFEVMEK